MSKKIVLVLLFLSGAGHFIYGQDCSLYLSGKIEDEHNREPLAFATIYIEELNSGVAADEDGNFIIEHLCKGNYSIKLQHASCESKVVQVVVDSSKEGLVFKLEHHTSLLNDIVVEGTASDLETKSISQIKGKELVMLKGESLGKSLEQISGVNVLQTGPTIFKPVVHGMHSSRIAILNDGLKLEGQQWGQDHAPEIDPTAASSLEVIKGAAAVRYGPNAMGGVVMVKSQPLQYDNHINGEVMGGFNSNGKEGLFSGKLFGGFSPKANWAWYVQSTVKRGGDRHSPDYVLTNTGNKEIDYQVRLGHKTEKYGFEVAWVEFDTDLAILRSAHVGNLTDLCLAIGSDRPFYVEPFSYEINAPSQSTKHNTLRANGYWNTNIGQWKALVGYQKNSRQEYDIRRSSTDDRPALDVELQAVSGELVFLPLGDLNGTFGITVSQKANRNLPGTGVAPIIPDFNETEIGVFGMESFTIRRMTWEAGLRYDFRYLEVYTFDEERELIKPAYTFQNFTASIGTQFDPSSKWKINSNIGAARRAPNISELFSKGLHHGSGRIEEGLMYPNGVLRLDWETYQPPIETGIKWITGVEYSSEKVSFGTELYYQYFINYIFLEPKDVRQTIRGAFPVFGYSDRDAQFYGLDANANWDIVPSFSWSAKGSFVRGYDVIKTNPLPLIPGPVFEMGWTYRRAHLGGLVDPFVTLKFQHNFKQNFAPQVVSACDIGDLTDQEIAEIKEAGAFDFLAAPNAYSVINADMGFNLVMKHAVLTTQFSVSNMFDVSYRNYMDTFRYFSDAIGRNFQIKFIYNFQTHNK